ncbi:hypothetical protein C3B51_09260 [Pseudoalteromonas rubra]|uniref:4-alpha-L-fucosyltransferase n=1 Tax=Pseudoalteromonas rubra TaxID=43658 RepID=A0A4Q7EDV1_9GAMM|nr:TDP-N-acetylfucosamine:lipid II N-acetylfucosaminyltransferase [Pseudoalteromonas rubra]RZM81167.1 hypothetical protein C3B51_09260 [Pseudoalteromonas rubra]
MRVLHISSGDKFIFPFIELIEDNFKFDEHHFLISEGIASKDALKASNVFVSDSSTYLKIKRLVLTLIKIHRAERVIIHGLFDLKLIYILFLCPWVLSKCYWFIWGGDLYTFQSKKVGFFWKIKERIKKSVIKRIGHLVTYVPGDIEIARAQYQAQGSYHECLMYLSNLYRSYELPKRSDESINIQVGNSADPSNNHLEVLELLRPFSDSNIKVYVPLSYGNRRHAEEVISVGQEWFGDKFKPITELMPFDEYLSFLGKIDIAFFNHNRQQAMGNIITLLGLGKTVYLRSGTSHWDFFQSQSLDVKAISEFDSLEKETLTENEEKVKKYFSMDNYLNQLSRIFND